MKTILCTLITGFLLTGFSCGEKSNKETNVSITTNDPTRNSKTMNGNSPASPDKRLDYIVFGRFCGECGGECATMYKLDLLNNKLFADHTDSYWEHKRGTLMKFETEIHNETKKSFAKQILDSIPAFILTTNKPTERFGCPDCTDGCGIYLETKNDTTIRQFYIDNQTEQLTGEIKSFAEYLRKIIDKL